MDHNTQAYELVLFFNRYLRIPIEDSRQYAKSLLERGYDDLQAIIEDVSTEESKEFMKMGHQKRFEFFKTKYEF